MIDTVGFLQLSTIDGVTKYRVIPVSRYFFRRYIIVGHLLMLRFPTRNVGSSLWLVLHDVHAVANRVRQ